MKLIIDIPEELFEAYKGRSPRLGDEGMDMIAQAIANGTPVPKGHGRLIDADALNFNADYNEPLISKLDFDCAPTIIEADNAESEDKKWQ